MVDIGVVQKSIFLGAHDAIWRAFLWHKGAAAPTSSQALAVSVFGTLAVHPERQALISEGLSRMFGWDSQCDHEWEVEPEKRWPGSLMRERRPTQVDVLIQNKTGVALLE